MVDASYTEVSCTRALNGSLFEQGIQDYAFSIGGVNTWIPSKSYFRITLQLNRLATANAPLMSDQLAYADNCGANLFTTSSFKMGGVEVRKLSSFAQQASSIKM